MKGQYKVKNVRLIKLITIVHSLAFRFQDMYVDWIERSQNSVADMFAKYACKPRLVSEQHDVFKVFFSL